MNKYSRKMLFQHLKTLFQVPAAIKKKKVLAFLSWEKLLNNYFGKIN